MKKLLAIAIAAIALTGCATNAEYSAYIEAHKARAASETARFNALKVIASQGDTTAAVAAAMALAQAGGSGNQPQIAAPVSAGETALRWASVLSPVITQGYIASQNARVSITQSNNAAAVASSTNNAFVGIASQIQAPGAVTTTTTTTTNTDSFNDSTSVPTVVDQPAPIVVQPVTP